MAGMTPNAALLQELRRALHYLYVPAELRQSPLVGLFGLNEPDGPTALRHVLLEGIEALKPDPSIPRQARPWRSYDSLHYLYVQQFGQREVATALAISTRQLRRQERLGLHALAEWLCARYRLQTTAGAGGPQANPGVRAAGASSPSREQELAWLERSFPTEPAGIAELLQAVRKITVPLAQALAVDVEWHVPAALPRVVVQVASMRQALLNTITSAVRSVAGGRVAIAVEAQGGQVSVQVRAFPCPAGAGPTQGGYPESLQMARQLVALSGGSLEVVAGQGDEESFAVRVVLPAAEQLAVLVIDDNVDTLQLFQRYLAGSRYPFVGARDPQQALAVIEEMLPQIIVLDVMLPGVDGWELLGQLREHSKTCGVPIVVCTILPEEELALTLGAAAFIRKPVSRAAFLQALDRVAGLLPRGSG